MRKKLYGIWIRLPRWGKLMAIIAGVLLGLLLIVILVYLGIQTYSQQQTNSSTVIQQWFREPASRPNLITRRKQCSGAPFILPSDGFIGLLWADPAGPYS